MRRNQKSIVLVTVDCFRSDHAGFMGYKRQTTPFLDSLAKESVVFRQAIAAGSPTYYSVPAILASRYPLALGRDVLGLGPDELTLATVLKSTDYATAAFVAGNPYIARRFGYDRGFDVFRDFLEEEAALPSGDSIKGLNGRWGSRLNRKLQKIRPALGPVGAVYDEMYFRYCQRVAGVPESLDALRRFPAADTIVDEALHWIDTVGDTPFFLWLHLMDPHAPYYPKQEALARLGESPIRPYQARYLNSYWNRSDLGPRRLRSRCHQIVALYDAGIRWVDAQMGRLVEALRNKDRWNDCIFALTADHGEEFLDHGGRFHPPSRLMEELIHVPLLLRTPGHEGKKQEDSPFGLIHLGPTLLEAADAPIPEEFRGRSYWQAKSPSATVAVSECVAGCTNPFRRENRMGARVLSVREYRFKLVLFFDRAAENLYDLEADPKETAPIDRSAQIPVRRRLLEIAREHLRHSTECDLRSRAQAQLRELQLEWVNQQKKLPAMAV
jgi:arylsulfatase A-like enzyme